MVGAVKINGGPVLQQCNHAVNGGIQVDDGIVIGIDGFFQTGLGVVHIAGCRGKTFRLRGIAERHMAPVIVNDIKLPVAAEVFQGFLHDQGSSFLHHSGRLVLERRLSPFTAVPCQDAQGIIMNGISAQVHDTDGAEPVFVEQVNEGGVTRSAAAQFRIRKHADGGNSGHDAEGSGMREGNDVGFSGKPGHCVPMVTVQGKMVPRTLSPMWKTTARSSGASHWERGSAQDGRFRNVLKRPASWVMYSSASLHVIAISTRGQPLALSDV